jgi:hypothetical protein
MSEQQNDPNPNLQAITAQTMRQGEMAIAAMAAKAKAEVEARYVIALRNKRNINSVRVQLLAACKRKAFAQGARYRKPVGGNKFVVGFSIRFAEEAIKCMTNVSTEAMVVWDDDAKRDIRVTVTDLETNTTYGDDIVLQKVVERKQLKAGQQKLGERLNSYGDRVFLVAATEEEMLNKVNAAKSKIIRNNGLRLIPQDLLEESLREIEKAMEGDGQDVKAETKKICDAFFNIGVPPQELERYLKHSLDTISPAELGDLRNIYTAIDDEETTWNDVCPSETKGPGQTAPADQSTASDIDAAVIEKPYGYIKEMCKKDDVTEAQVHLFMKSKGLAGKTTEELPQASDANLRTVIRTWRSVLPHIKATKA